MPGHARRQSVMSCAKTTEPIKMPFGLWTAGGPKEACVTWDGTLAPPGAYD